MIAMEADSSIELPLDTGHHSIVYLLHGDVVVNKDAQLLEEQQQLIAFNQDGSAFTLQANAKSQLLFLSGTPFNEPMATWGPYVMNTQTQIMEALRDYQAGKMGYLSVS